MVLGGTATISTQILHEESYEVVIGGAHLGLVVYLCLVLSSVLETLFPLNQIVFFRLQNIGF